MLRFQKLDDEEQRDQRTLKLKKELIKQEFDYQEELKKYDNLSVGASTDFKFKAELDKLQTLNKEKQAKLQGIIKAGKQPSPQKSHQSSQMHASTSTFGCIRSINNHHSDPLFETMSRNIASRTPEDLALFMEQLREQQMRYDDLILEEQEKGDQLKVTLGEIEKSKLILQQKVEEMQLLDNIAGKRYANTETLHFLAKEKNEISKKNLKAIKSELQCMQQMRVDYKKSQNEKQQDLQKVIYVGEENIGHNVLKIEEAETLNKELEQELERLDIQEQRILKKRHKSRYILKYIECFEKFQSIFMNRISETGRIVDQYTVDEEKLKSIDTQQNAVHFESAMGSQVDLDFDRNELLSQINRFYSQGENRTQIIMDFMLEKYWHLHTTLTQCSVRYEDLLQLKERHLIELDNSEQQLMDLQNNNPNLESHEQSMMAEDAGLMQTNDQTTTLNIRMMECEENNGQVLINKATSAQKMLMKFQLSLAELMSRLYQTILVIEEKNKDIKKFKYQNLIMEMQEFEQFVAQVYHQLPHFKRGCNTPSESQHHHDPQFNSHLSLYQIVKIFQDVFSGTPIEQVSHYFYVQCKTDQILWFHLTQDNIRSFLQNVRQEQNNAAIGTDRINQLRDSLVEVFLSNFNKLLLQYQHIHQKVKDYIIDLHVYLKENNPKFDPSKLSKIVPREGQEIKQAKEQIIKRMVEYRTGESMHYKKDLLGKVFKPKTEEEPQNAQNNVLFQGLVKVMQPEINAQNEIFLLEKDLDQEGLNHVRSFFRAKLHQKNEPVMLKKQVEKKEIKKAIKKDELEVERESIKTQIAQDIQRMQEEKERKAKPELKEQQNERKTQIKEAVERLYGERGHAAHMLKTMALTTNILSDIDRLENQQSKIEQPQLVGQFVMQRKNMHRNLNKDLTLPTLSYLKPTSAYFSRRNQSSEQIKMLDHKRYYEIEHGVSSRPQTQQTRPKTQQIARKAIAKQSYNTDLYKQRYGTKSDPDYVKFPIPIQEYPQQEKPKSILVAKLN